MLTPKDFYEPWFGSLSPRQQIAAKNQLLEQMGLDLRLEEVTDADVDAYINRFKT